MPVGAVFIPNPAGIMQLSLSPGVTAACMAMAGEMAVVIRQLIPQRPAPPSAEDTGAEQGELRKSIMVWPGVAFGDEALVEALVFHAAPGAGARVLSTDWRFHWIEFGTAERETESGAYRGEMSPKAPFRKASEMTGRFIPNATAQDTVAFQNENEGE